MNQKKDILFGLVFFLVASAVSFCAGELAVRFIASHTLVYNIEMLKYANELKMRDPLHEISHVHVPNSSARLMGVDITLNSLGNRGPELREPKPPNEKRIYVAGASVSLGWGVPEEQVFSALVQNKLNQTGNSKFQFINAGVGNYNTFAETKLFYRQFEKVQPDMVILNYFVADVEPRGMGSDNPLLKKSYLAAFLYNGIRALRFTNQNNNLFDYYNSFYSEDSSAWKNTRTYILEMRDFLKQRNIPLLVMIVPDFHNLGAESPFKVLYPKIESALQGMNIPTLNTFPEFQKAFGDNESQVWIQTSDPHPNAAGHKLMADLLYDYFQKYHPLVF